MGLLIRPRCNLVLSRQVVVPMQPAGILSAVLRLPAGKWTIRPALVSHSANAAHINRPTNVHSVILSPSACPSYTITRAPCSFKTFNCC